MNTTDPPASQLEELPQEQPQQPRPAPTPGFARDLLGGVDVDALLAVDITEDFEGYL